MVNQQRCHVLRGEYCTPVHELVPFSGIRAGNVLAYDLTLPDTFTPWPGRTRTERVSVLLDVGVNLSNPCWSHMTYPDGQVVTTDPQGQDSWYVDLVKVEQHEDTYIIRDLYIDIIVPTDGRHSRMLDLDEFADALAEGTISLPDAIDGLRRWQRFLDTYLYSGRWPTGTWSDFPPRACQPLATIPIQ